MYAKFYQNVSHGSRIMGPVSLFQKLDLDLEVSTDGKWYKVIKTEVKCRCFNLFVNLYKDIKSNVSNSKGSQNFSIVVLQHQRQEGTIGKNTCFGN